MEKFQKEQEKRKEINRRYKEIRNKIENEELEILHIRIAKINQELNKEIGNLDPKNYSTRIKSVEKLRQKRDQTKKEIIKIHNSYQIQQRISENGPTRRNTKCSGKSIN